MPINWTPEMDRTLMRVVDEMPEGTWPDRASTMSAEVGVPITEDMIRNRYRRVINDIETARVTPHVEPVLNVPAQPEGSYVGFNMAFYDIESSGLNGWGNEMTCASIVDNFGNLTHATKFEFPQDSVLDDHRLVVWLRDTLETYDILVGWYGTMFDLPFMNAKLIEYGERPIRDMMYIDPCFKTRGGRYGLKVGSGKLKNVAKWLNTPNQKPEVEWKTFRLASIGDPPALAEVLDRCDADVRVMRDIFQHIKPMIRTIHR